MAQATLPRDSYPSKVSEQVWRPLVIEATKWARKERGEIHVEAGHVKKKREKVPSH